MASQDAVYAYFYLHLFAFILITFLLLTIFLSRGSAKRDPTVISLLVIYGIISPVAYNLTLFQTAGSQEGTPDSRLCLAQAGLTAGLQSLQAAGLLGLVVKLFAELLAVSRRTQSVLDSTPTQVVLLGLPYALWISDMIATIVFARNGSDNARIDRGDFFYSLDFYSLSRAFAVIDVVLFVLVAVFLLCSLVLVIRRYISFRNLGGEVVSPSSLLVAFSEVDIGLAIRVVLFSTYVGVAFGTSSLLLSERHPLVWVMSAAAAGPILFLTFGSQWDILHLWMHPFRLLAHRLTPPTSRSSTPTLRDTPSPDPFPPQTIQLSPSKRLTSPAAPPSPTASVGLNTMLTRGSSLRSTFDWGAAPRTPSPCLWTKDGRWRESLFVEEGGEAKELSFHAGDGAGRDVFGKVEMTQEEREWREGMKKRDQELARELKRVKGEVGGVKRELSELRREVGEMRAEQEEEEEQTETEEDVDEGDEEKSQGEEEDTVSENESMTETESDVSWGDGARGGEVRDRPGTPTFK